jgi:hypothetical protein
MNGEGYLLYTDEITKMVSIFANLALAFPLPFAGSRDQRGSQWLAIAVTLLNGAMKPRERTQET